MRRDGVIKWGLIIQGWTLLAFIYSGHLYLFHSMRGEYSIWSEELVEALAHFYAWAALSPFILYLSRRFGFRRGRRVQFTLIHLLAAIIFSVLQIALHTAIDVVVIHGRSFLYTFDATFKVFFARTFYFGLLVYVGIIAIHHVIAYYRGREVLEAQLEMRLAQAQLQALKMQLHPHFLFNTLHAISSLMHEDVKAADEMLNQLSDLLRATLLSRDIQEVPLEEELKLLRLYLEIEKTRFGDRLTFNIKIDPEATSAYVPNLILQPLVENSIRHGINKRRGTGYIEILARRQADILKITVRDNGVGLTKDGRQNLKAGIGLTNTLTRLSQLYGGMQEFELRKAAGGGAEVLLTIPFHTRPCGRGG